MCLDSEFEVIYKIPYSYDSKGLLPDINEKGQMLFLDPAVYPIVGDKDYLQLKVLTGTTAQDIRQIQSSYLSQMVQAESYTFEPAVRPPKLAENGLAVIFGQVKKGSGVERRLLIHDTVNNIDVAALDTGVEFKRIGEFDAMDDGAVFIAEKMNQMGGVYKLKNDGTIKTLFERKHAYLQNDQKLRSVQATSDGQITVWYNDQVLLLSEASAPTRLIGTPDNTVAEISITGIQNLTRPYSSIREGDRIKVDVRLFLNSYYASDRAAEALKGYRVGVRTKALSTESFEPVDTVLTFAEVNTTQSFEIQLLEDSSYSLVKKSLLIELVDLKDDDLSLYPVDFTSSGTRIPGEVVAFVEKQSAPDDFEYLSINRVLNPDEPIRDKFTFESAGYVHFERVNSSPVGFTYEVIPWTASVGKDFEATRKSLSFTDRTSQTQQMSFQIPILADNVYEGLEYAILVFSDPVGNILLPAPEVVTIYDNSWERIQSEYSRSSSGSIVFNSVKNGDVIQYDPVDGEVGSFKQSFYPDKIGNTRNVLTDSGKLYAGDFLQLDKWQAKEREAVFYKNSPNPIAGYRDVTIESFYGTTHFAANKVGQVVFGAENDAISADGKKWNALFRTVVSAPRLEIVSMEEVPSDPNQRPFSSFTVWDAFNPKLGDPRYKGDFLMDLKVVLKNTGNASTGPILAEYFRYTTTNGKRSQPWSIGIAPKKLVAIDEKGESKQFNGIEPGEEVTLYFQDIESPIFDENISKDFQGERGKHETNILHELRLKPENLPDEVLSVTTSASTDHQNYRSEGEDFLDYLNWLRFDNAANLYDRFLNGNGTPLVSPATSKLAGDIGDSPIYAEWLKQNVLSAAIAEVRKIISEGGKAGEYTLKFGGRDVPQTSLSFPFGRLSLPGIGNISTYPTDLGLAIGGTQPNAPSANWSSDTIGGHVKLVIDSIPFPVPETFSGNFRLLTTLRDLYQFDHGDNFKSRLNVFARGQQISGEAEWFHHEFTVESSHSFIFGNISKSETKPGDHSVLDVGSAKGINGELLLSPVIDQARPAGYLSTLTEPSVTSVQVGISRNSFETLRGTGTLHLFGRSGVEWKEIGSQAITAQSTLTTDFNGDVVFSVKLDKSGLAQTPFELGFAFISTASAPIPLAITFIQFYENAPELYLQHIGLSPNDNVIRFGDATQGADTQGLVLANSGNSELVISRVQVSGNHFEVELSGVIFPLILLPGEKRIVSLLFDGSAPASGQLRVDWNSPTGFSEFLLDASANEGVPSIISDLDFHVSDKSYSLLDIRTYDSDSAIVRLEVDEPATHVLVVDSGRIAFVPRADDPPSFVLPFKLKASDTGFPQRNSEYEGTISINAPNAQPDEVAAWTDRATKLNILANDSNPIGDLADMRIFSSMPQFGVLTLNADGLSYLPNPGATSSTDEFTYRLVNSFGVASRNTTVKIWLVEPSAKIFHNANLKEDVDGDGEVSPLDALLVINQLNSRSLNNASFGMLQPLPPAAIRYRFDTSGDNLLSPVDALIVINWLNRRSLHDAEGEVFADFTENYFAMAVNNVDMSFVGLGFDLDIGDHESSHQRQQTNLRFRRKSC